MKKIFHFALGTFLFLSTNTVLALNFIQETGNEIGQTEVEIIPGILDFDGFIVLTLAIISTITIFSAYKVGGLGGYIGKFFAISLTGVAIIAINISFGDLWDPVSLSNPLIDDMEDVIEIIGFSIITIGSILFYRDIKKSITRT